MKRTTLSMLIGLPALLLVALTANATDPQKGQFDVLDLNRDGQLTPSEVKESSTLSNQWTAIDQDENGTINRVEFSAFETDQAAEKKSSKEATDKEMKMKKDGTY